jgi:hypothetical protein
MSGPLRPEEHGARLERRGGVGARAVVRADLRRARPAVPGQVGDMREFCRRDDLAGCRVLSGICGLICCCSAPAFDSPSIPTNPSNKQPRFPQARPAPPAPRPHPGRRPRAPAGRRGVPRPGGPGQRILILHADGRLLHAEPHGLPRPVDGAPLDALQPQPPDRRGPGGLGGWVGPVAHCFGQR